MFRLFSLDAGCALLTRQTGENTCKCRAESVFDAQPQAAVVVFEKMDAMDVDKRRKRVAWVLSMTKGTPLEPDEQERHWLALYQDGELTLSEVIDLLDQRKLDEH